MIFSSRPAQVFLCAVALLPVGVEAQTTDRFDALQEVLEAGQRVAITHGQNQTTTGRVAALSAGSLTLQVPTTQDNPQGRQTFAEGAVTKVVRQDSVVNGTLIGLGIGFAALWGDVRRRCGPAGYDPECDGAVAAVGMLTIVGTSAAAGALIDLAIVKTVYRSSARSEGSRLGVSPWVGRRTTGVTLSLRF
jgi:hypothetical protein